MAGTSDCETRDDWFLEQDVNAWSSLAYLGAGLILAWEVHRRRLPPAALGLAVAVAAEGVGSLVYQGVIVAFASYLIWFWLLTRYLAGRLAVFGFLTPLAGVAFGVMLLGERVTPVFGVGALLVGAGIVLVNAPRAKA